LLWIHAGVMSTRADVMLILAAVANIV
jgi:hypothetical protein